MTPKKRGLGKGLDALLSTSTAARQKQVMSDQRTEQAMAPTNQGNCVSCRWSGCSPANTNRARICPRMRWRSWPTPSVHKG